MDSAQVKGELRADSDVIALTGGPADLINLNSAVVRLLLAKTAKHPYTDRVLRDYDVDQLMEIARWLWIYGREYWSHTIEKCHRLIMRSNQNRPATSAEISIFEAVKQTVRIEEFAARFTDLVPAGSNREKGRCPLHDERTGSFMVYLDTQRWYCYGTCGAGGDVIELGRLLMGAGKW